MQKNKLPRFVGHRGTRDQRPENTREAFDYVYALKPLFEALGSSVSFEFDVRLTQDNVPVLIHDESLDRTSGVHKLVADISYQEMKQIHFNKDMTYVSGTLITLSEMFERYPDVVFDAEIKEQGERGIELAKVFIDLIEQYDAAERMIMHIPCLEVSKFAVENFPKGCRFELPNSVISDFQKRVFKGEAVERIPGYHQMCLEFRGLIDGEVVEFTANQYADKTRELGYPIVTFWENRSVPKVDEATLRAAIAAGADSVIIDDALQALKVFSDIYASGQC